MVEYGDMVILLVVIAVFVAIAWILDHFLRKYLDRLAQEAHVPSKSGRLVRIGIIFALSLGAIYTILRTYPTLNDIVESAWMALEKEGYTR